MMKQLVTVMGVFLCTMSFGQGYFTSREDAFGYIQSCFAKNFVTTEVVREYVPKQAFSYQLTDSTLTIYTVNTEKRMARGKNAKQFWIFPINKLLVAALDKGSLFTKTMDIELHVNCTCIKYGYGDSTTNKKDFEELQSGQIFVPFDLLSDDSVMKKLPRAFEYLGSHPKKETI